MSAVAPPLQRVRWLMVVGGTWWHAGDTGN